MSHFSPPIPPTLVCLRCGRKVPVAAAFCPACGYPVSTGWVSSAPPFYSSLPGPYPQPLPPHKHTAYQVVIATLLVAIMLIGDVFAYNYSTTIRTPIYSVSQSGASMNWSGYVYDGSAGSVSVAKATWVVPTVDCPSALTSTQIAAFWVGIDGSIASQGTVEQTGFEVGCAILNGFPTPFYAAWYEWVMLPVILRQQIINRVVKPGDVISAQVSWENTARRFRTFIEDRTQLWSYTSYNSTIASAAARSSAEWVVEAPSNSSGVFPLANFDVVYFTSCQATVSGRTGPMGSFSLRQDTMQSSDSQVGIKAEPILPLWNDGTNFSVRWMASGP